MIDLLKLRLSGAGFNLYFDFTGCLFFADDVLLLSGSIMHLQFMSDICAQYGNDNFVNFNHAIRHFMWHAARLRRMYCFA